MPGKATETAVEGSPSTATILRRALLAILEAPYIIVDRVAAIAFDRNDSEDVESSDTAEVQSLLSKITSKSEESKVQSAQNEVYSEKPNDEYRPTNETYVDAESASSTKENALSDNVELKETPVVSREPSVPKKVYSESTIHIEKTNTTYVDAESVSKSAASLTKENASSDNVETTETPVVSREQPVPKNMYSESTASLTEEKASSDNIQTEVTSVVQMTKPAILVIEKTTEEAFSLPIKEPIETELKKVKKSSLYYDLQALYQRCCNSECRCGRKICRSLLSGIPDSVITNACIFEGLLLTFELYHIVTENYMTNSQKKKSAIKAIFSSVTALGGGMYGWEMGGKLSSIPYLGMILGMFPYVGRFLGFFVFRTAGKVAGKFICSSFIIHFYGN